MYKISEFAKLINKCVLTLQRWDREGVLVAQRTPKGRRFYTHDQYLEYISSEKISKNPKDIISKIILLLVELQKQIK